MAADASRSEQVQRPSLDWLAGGGEMGERIRAFDWAKTPLGPVESWPQSLRSAVSMLLPSKAQIVLFWGRDFTTLYNDGYRPVFGGKHPHVLGLPGRESWSELWEAGLRGLLEGVVTTGEAYWASDRPFYLERYGYAEETYFDVSYDPVRDETAAVGGVYCIVSETTDRVIAARRLATLRQLAVETSVARDAEEACALAARTLAKNPSDVPFALIYLAEPDGGGARLVASAGLAPGGRAAPPRVDFVDGEGCLWPFDRALRGERVECTDLARIVALPGAPWPEPTHTAVVMPLANPAQDLPAGLLVLGASPRRALDDNYQGFMDLVATSIRSAIDKARAYEEERKRAEALAVLDRAKTAFFSNVSHEFRTPLTLMLGPLEDLKHDLGGAADPRSMPHYRQIELVHRNGLRLLKLVNTLLDFSRIEAGRAQAVFEATDLSSYTAELASVFRSAVEKAGLRLVIDCPALREPVYVDREMWEKIVLNLVSNAFKFTFKGEIEVRLRAAERHVELTVRDTGIGIPADEVPRLFERFHRVAGAQGRTHEGSGIGLALVQELARLHGGAVSVGTIDGQGSTFRVSIPAGKSHLPAEQIGATRTQASTALGAQPFIEEALRWLPDADAADDSAEGLPIATPTPEAERPRVLLADDNADMRDYVRRLLGAHFEVEAVADGEAALAAIGQRLPDLVLSDVMMPRLDGLALTTRLRADPRTRSLPIILLSARAGEDAKLEGLAAGADDYLIKPFSARELVAHVAMNIKAARIRHEATAAVRESNTRLQLALDASGMGTFTWHVPDDRGEPDSRMLALVGLTEGSPLTPIDTLARLIHPADGERYADAVARAVDPAASGLLREEVRVVRPDGTERWLDITAQTTFEGSPRRAVRMSGLAADITERKQAEQTQRLLVNELNHRVKNTLASVQAIVQYTLRRTKDPAEFVSSFAGRIQSLSRVHSILSSTSWQGADLRALIHDQLLLGSVDETRLTTWGPSVRLESQMALHMALMLHELGTNSIKYGALSNARGQVTISWTVEDRQLRLRWLERGGPAVRAPTTRGFGMTLIEQSTRGEGGSARMAIEADGIVWEIVLPLPRPVASDALQTHLAEPRAGPLPPHAVARAPRRLAGKRFLVVEDETLVALDIVANLEDAGAEVTGSVGTVNEALRIIDNTPLDAALLDGNLRGEPVDEIASLLTRRKVPFLFVSGYGSASLPRAFGQVALLGKPFSPQQLVEAAAQLVEQPSGVVRLRE